MSALEFLERQLADYFERLNKGQDVSPAQRYRLEGYLRACLDANMISAEALFRLKQRYAGKSALTNSAELPLVGEAVAWQLPYRVAVAPVSETP